MASSSNGGSAANGGIAANGESGSINYLVLVFGGTRGVRTTVTASPQVASSWVQEVLRSYNSLPSGSLKLVGLATETQPNLLPGDNHPTAVLQLCVDDNCLIFQLLHCNPVTVIPPDLRSLLNNPVFYFASFDMIRDAGRLQREHGLSVRVKKDLRLLAALMLIRRDLVRADMKRLVKEVAGREVARPEAVRMSAWQQPVLSPQQITYACTTAFAASLLGNVLLADYKSSDPLHHLSQ